MKYYDINEKKYYDKQNAGKTRIAYPDGLINDFYEQAKNGERVDLSSFTLPKPFDKQVIVNNCLYLELKYLVAHNGDAARIAEIRAVLTPPEDELRAEV